MISYIVPTGDRSIFCRQALNYIARQRGVSKYEIVIVDGGGRKLSKLSQVFTHGQELRYIDVRAGTTTGDRRNIACEAARGDVIVHIDDDDWYAPDYTITVVSRLLETDAAVSGLVDFYFYDVFRKRGWKTIKLLVPTGATMAYRRSTWKETPFRPVRLGEDNDFLSDLGQKGATFAITDRDDQFIYMRHRKNSSLGLIDPIFDASQTRGARQILGADVAFYDDLAELVPGGPETPKDIGPQWHLPAPLRQGGSR